MLVILSEHCKKTISDLVDKLMKKVEKALALELLMHLVLKNEKEATGSANKAPDEFESVSPSTHHLINCILDSSADQRYKIRAEFNIPLIGVGAPIRFFLPGAQKIFNTPVIIPENADVANALGAITSHITICQKLVVRPDGLGGLVVEGVAGTRKFNNLREAQEWAEKYLRSSILDQAVKAGTSVQDVDFDMDDRIVNVSRDVPLFIERTITATLIGNPDLARQIK